MVSRKVDQARVLVGENLRSFFELVKSADFFKGFVLVLAILVVLTCSIYFGSLETGISLTMGIFISAPANVQGSSRHRMWGILASTVLGMVATIAVNFASVSFGLLIPVLGLLIFSVSLISVYGFRASLVSLSGLLSIILSFAQPKTGADIFIHAGLMGMGGLWYLLFSHVSNLLAHKNHTLQLMAEAMELTGEYLRTRGRLALGKGNDPNLQIELFELQKDLNEKHEVLREILLSSRRHSGRSNFSRRQVLIFIELVDILELAIGNLPNLHKLQNQFENQPQSIKPFTDLLFEMAGQLEHLAGMMGPQQVMVQDNLIGELLQEAENAILAYSRAAEYPEAREKVLLLQNTLDYFIQQSQKIEVIQKVMANLLEKDQSGLSPKESAKFISQQDYDWKVLIENLSFRSPIFRHSLRLTITVLVGFAIGHIFSLQNSYWILLTIVVIMRPGYTLTKQRSKHRLYGTLIGGAIAVGLVLLIQNTFLYAVLAMISFMLSFSLVRKNYRSSAIFITINTVSVYALMRPDAVNVIEYRVLDTLTGAVLAIIANSFFWPAWEYLNIQEYIEKAIRANTNYLREIGRHYQHKDFKDSSYKLSRKEAFLAIGDLSAALQRMMEEPKSRQKNLAKINELVELNHTFLSLAAALGTYIRHNKTTEASLHFGNYIDSIIANLDFALAMLTQAKVSEAPKTTAPQEAQKYLDGKYRDLMARQASVKPENRSEALTIPPELQEVKLVADQLKWMYTVSENVKNVVHTLSRGVL